MRSVWQTGTRQQQQLQRNAARQCARWGTGTTCGAAGWARSKWRSCSVGPVGRCSPGLDSPRFLARLKSEHKFPNWESKIRSARAVRNYRYFALRKAKDFRMQLRWPGFRIIIYPIYDPNFDIIICGEHTFIFPKFLINYLFWALRDFIKFTCLPE